MIADELSHIVKQHVSQAMIDQRPFVYGHIATYDPTTHRARCIIPSLTDQDGRPLLSPWMPMGTLFAGDGYGIQPVYAGGATADNPTAGEQVLIGLFDRYRGVAAIPCVFHSGTSVPPSTQLPQGSNPVAAGDLIIRNPSKSMLRFHPNGDLELIGVAKLTATIQGDVSVTNVTGNTSVTTQQGNTAVTTSTGNTSITTHGTTTVSSTGDLVLATAAHLGVTATGTASVSSTGDVTINTQGHATVSAGGNATISTNSSADINAAGAVTVTAGSACTIFAPVIQLAKAATDALQALCTQTFLTWVAEHTHGTSGPPTAPPLPPGTLTTVTIAE